MSKMPQNIQLIDLLKVLRDLKKSPEAIGILLLNLFFLVMVILFPEERYLVVAAYFLETLIIGIFNIIKLLIIAVFNPRGEKPQSNGAAPIRFKERIVSLGSGLFFIVFFIFHFGMFYVVQLSFIAGMIGPRVGDQTKISSLLPDPVVFFQAALGQQGIYIFLSILLVQVSFLLYRFIIKKEYRVMNFMTQGMQPYGRILVQQFVILIGGFIIIFFPEAIVLSILLIVLKTFVDIIAQLMSDTTLDRKIKAGIAPDRPPV